MPCYEFEGRRPLIHPTSFVHPTATLIGAPVVDVESALAEGASQVHPRVAGNVYVERVFRRGDPERVLAEAPHRVRRTFQTQPRQSDSRR